LIPESSDQRLIAIAQNRVETLRARDRQRSVVFAEYVLVTGVIVLAVGLALYGLGAPLVQAFFLTKLLILLPFP
jgi:hypothetical protein